MVALHWLNKYYGHTPAAKFGPLALKALQMRMVEAGQSRRYVNDNIDRIRRCLSTGGGFATRELYSDADEVIFDAMRPAILTSIVELAEKGDLLDRCLPVSLPPIGEDRRRDEKTLWAEFEAARPKILGSLFDAVAGALRDLPRVKLVRLPRMADFAKWATAAERALGWPPGTFIAAYTRNRDAANELALEASPIAGRLLELLAKGEWEGKAGELLSALDESYGSETKRPPGWPKNPRSMSGHLRRLAPCQPRPIASPIGYPGGPPMALWDGKPRTCQKQAAGGHDRHSTRCRRGRKGIHPLNRNRLQFP
ncbi:MAG TPA: hypothetical protein VNH11_07000 [Pirellulales bacterium]|nr:hypothetical protein [Pirellulales bacterium]